MSVEGLDQLTVLAERLESVAVIGERGPLIAAEAIGETARAQYAAGRSPTGERWAPRKRDGAPALQRAPDRVTFHAQGDGLYEDAPDHYKYHRTGTRYMPKRSVFAAARGTLPTSWRAAVDKALEREFVRAMR